MPVESKIAEFELTVRDIIKQILPDDLVYVDTTFGLVPHPSGQTIPAVTVSLLSPAGIIGTLHSGFLFFGFNELSNLEIVRGKVREFKESLYKARSDVAAEAGGLTKP